MKTREEKIQNLEVIYADAVKACTDYNEAMAAEKAADAVKAAAVLTEKVGMYTAQAQDICFCDCRDSDDPMLTAVKTLTFQTITAKDDKIEGTDATVRKVEFKDRQIDLEKLHKFCKESGGIGADKKWIHMAQKLNYLFTAHKATELGIDPKEVNDSYAMSNIAREIRFGKNPLSNTSILKTLQSVITAMVGAEYKAVSHDVNYLKSVYSKKGKKALSVSCANHRYFYGYLMDVCHRIVMGKTYSVEFKAAK